MNKIIFALLVMVASAQADLAFSFDVGTITKDPISSEQNVDFRATIWHKWDQMVFLGITSGTDLFGEEYSVPLNLSALIRLPMGRNLMPVFVGDWGAYFGEKAGIMWRLGGGFDLKLGDRSSLMGKMGYQNRGAEDSAYLFISGGLLLEF